MINLWKIYFSRVNINNYDDVEKNIIPDGYLLSCYRENSNSPETCNDGVCSTTSPGEMTSVRTCYCKHEGNIARKKDNDIRIHNGNRHPATAVSKKSIVTNKACENGGKSTRRARRITDEKTVPNIFMILFIQRLAKYISHDKYIIRYSLTRTDRQKHSLRISS